MVPKKKISIKAIIIDHKLRKESSFEAIKTKIFLQKIGLNSLIYELTECKKNSGLQEWARIQRLKVLTSITESGNGILILGHHLNDQVETLMMRMFKNTGFIGAQGIKPIIFWNEVPIIRPLLNYTKENIHQTCKKYNLPFLIDPSNNNKNFERVRIRNLIKKMDKKDLNFQQLNRFCTSIRKINTIIDKSLNPIFDKFAPLNIFGWCEIDINWFLSLHDKIASKVLSNRIRIVSGMMYPADRLKVNNLIIHIRSFEKNMNNISGRTISGVKIKSWKGKLIIVRLPTKIILPVEMPTWGRTIFDGRWEIRSNKGLYFNYLNKEQSIKLRKVFDPDKKLPYEIWFTIPFLENPLHISNQALEEEIHNTHIKIRKISIDNISSKDNISIKFLRKRFI